MRKKCEHLVILATSDIHGNFTGYDFFENYTAPNGMARLYTAVQQIREAEDAVILIDGGDMIGDPVLPDNVCPEHTAETHPVMEIMNLLSYDAAVVGNHDFDFGTDYLEKTISQAGFPILAANVRRKEGSLFTGRSCTVIERGGIRVAVVGVVMPFVKITAKGAPGVSELSFAPGADAVEEALQELDGQYDVLVVSAHMGGYGEYDPENGSDSAWHIADVVPRTDILHMAHTHVIDLGRRGATLYGEVRDKVGELLRFDVYIGENGRVARSEVSVIDLADYEPSPVITELPNIIRIRQETVKAISEGEKTDNSPVIGQALKTFQLKNTQIGIPIARMQETPITNLINRVQLEFSGAEISACCLSKPNCNLAAGPITKRSVKDIYEYENYLVTVDITGRELKKYLELNAECYEAAEEGKPPLRLNKNFPAFQQDYFSGVSYEIHIKNKPGDRIRNIRFRDLPINGNQVFRLAVHNFRYSTVLKKNGIIAGNKLWQSEMTIREMLEDYISRNSPISPELEGNWKIII